MTNVNRQLTVTAVPNKGSGGGVAVMSDLPKDIGGHAELAWGHVVCTLE